MKKNNFIKYGIFTALLALGVSCTNLDEQIQDATPISNADPDAILTSAYNGLKQFQDQAGIFAISEVTTDFCIVPTRATDWGDGGAWLQDHKHSWDASSREVNNAWKQMLSSVYNCDLVLAIQSIPADKKAQAQFLKAFYYYNAIDIYGQVPYREAGSSIDDFPKVWDSPTATAQIIALLKEALPNLPDKNASDPSVASKDAANFLLAKIYLNKAVFDSPTHTGFNANNIENMNEVIKYVDAISTSTTLAPDYWDNFKPSNNTSPELILTSKNVLGVDAVAGLGINGMRARWFMSGHYNQTPSGWNGFSVLQEYYNQFDPSDRRIKNDDPAIINALGSPLGMRIGQQYAPAGKYDQIKVDGSGNFLLNSKGAFDIVLKADGKTPEQKTYAAGVYPLSTRGDNGSLPLNFQSDPAGLPADGKISSAEWLERWGIRPQKYIPDPSNMDKPENDYVIFRYADALLMKAEAIKRGGTGSLGNIQNDLQSRKGITTTIDLSTLDGIYTARATELWEEGWRRNDMIRFGKYTTSRATMTNTAAHTVLMPIPTTALLNPNLKQNPGY